MAQIVTVVDYDSAWPQAFAAEKEKLAALLGRNCLAVYHIGSTAVPGLAAKPVIDMLPVVRSLAEVDGLTDAFARLGYESLGEYGIPGRRYLRKGGDRRTHQAHIFAWTDMENIARHLALRDYMRADAAAREAYAALKKTLAARFPRDIDGYCDGKDAFVRQAEAEALARWDGSWVRLYLAARAVQNGRQVSPFVDAGEVAAALLTRSGRMYTGVCIDTACGLGMCAERSAIAAMLTGGDNGIVKLVAVDPQGSCIPPCGACCEALMQLEARAGELEILCEPDGGRSVRLRELLPTWWGANRFGQN